ncbi:MAG: hypothetical protein HY781_07700 [Chloroflexi bacterium]|nr:hypothetical protein [Chloroflexota bacterium]
MSTVKKILSVLGWIITIVLQIAFGQIAGTFALAIGRGKMPESMIFLGIGIAVGVYLIGALAILLRRLIRPKKYLARRARAIEFGLKFIYTETNISPPISVMPPMAAYTIVGRMKFPNSMVMKHRYP